MRILLLFTICFFIIETCNETFCQEEEGESIRIMFWNVENLFDPFDDSLTLDDEFTSRGDHNWTWERFNQKMDHVYKVMISAGWEPQAIIGLCEVENRWVLERLTRMTPLSKYEYHIIHHNSPDIRGIDVAMLYDPDSFIPTEIAFIQVTGLKNDDDPTRDILFVKGVLRSQDTVNIFVNHWPSRYPGQVQTIHKRQAAAAVLKRRTDSLIKSDPRSKIIIMGDFNDEPWDESISEILGVKFPGDALSDFELTEDELQKVELTTVKLHGFKLPEAEKSLNLSNNDTLKLIAAKDEIICNSLYSLIPPFSKPITGTLKFEGKWYLFDQFMISGALLKEISSIETAIMSHDFLLEPDEAYTGKKPFRTYNGYIYKGGYSDHLPILLKLIISR